MSEQLQLRRGTSAQVAAFTGAQGEVVMDTTNNRLVINDGSTAGGWAAAKLSEVVTNSGRRFPTPPIRRSRRDRLIAYTALTASRVVSLPTSAPTRLGRGLWSSTSPASCSATKTITLTPNGVRHDRRRELERRHCNRLWLHRASKATASADGSSPTSSRSPRRRTARTFRRWSPRRSSRACLARPSPGPSDPGELHRALGRRARVTTITGATSFRSASRATWRSSGQASAFAAGTTNYGLIGPTAFYSSTPILLTAAGSNFTAGAVRISVHYLLANPSAS